MEFKLDREPVTPKDAATVILVRPRAGGDFEIFCVERNKQSRFMGGAVVFPGGKLDASDSDDAWLALTTPPRRARPSTEPFANGDVHLRALAIAAARETLEEAALLLAHGGAVDDAEVSALRARSNEDPAALSAFLAERGLRLDLAALVPFARWITPVAEPRRFDTRFFVALAPEGQAGAHDERETMASFWASPREVLARCEAGEVTLWAPTHRTLSVLATAKTVDGVFALAETTCLDPICPHLLRQRSRPDGTPAADDDAEAIESVVVALPGDPAHPVREQRVTGSSRLILRDGRWLPENPQR